jgi:hypothetical protein
MTQVLDDARILILNILNYSFILMFYRSRMCIYHRTSCINTIVLTLIGCVCSFYRELTFWELILEM